MVAPNVLSQTSSNPYHTEEETCKTKCKRIGYSVGFGVSVMLLVMWWANHHHAQLHSGNFQHPYGAFDFIDAEIRLENGIPPVPNVGMNELLPEGTQDISGHDGEDDCTPGELDCNMIIPLSPEEEDRTQSSFFSGPPLPKPNASVNNCPPGSLNCNKFAPDNTPLNTLPGGRSPTGGPARTSRYSDVVSGGVVGQSQVPPSTGTAMAGPTSPYTPGSGPVSPYTPGGSSGFASSPGLVNDESESEEESESEASDEESEEESASEEESEEEESESEASEEASEASEEEEESDEEESESEEESERRIRKLQEGVARILHLRGAKR